MENDLPGPAPAELGRGPIGRQVAENLTRLRNRRNLHQRDLAARTKRLGVPLSVSALSKIEKHGRRVDVDDLVVLALGLGVSPNALLFPDDRIRPGCSRTYELTPKVSTTSNMIWAWATGDASLLVWADGENSELTKLHFDDGKPDAATLTEWERDQENRPHNWAGPYRFGVLTTPDLAEATEKLRESIKELLGKQGPDYVRTVVREMIFLVETEGPNDGPR